MQEKEEKKRQRDEAREAKKKQKEKGREQKETAKKAKAEQKKKETEQRIEEIKRRRGEKGKKITVKMVADITLWISERREDADDDCKCMDCPRVWSVIEDWAGELSETNAAKVSMYECKNQCGVSACTFCMSEEQFEQKHESSCQVRAGGG